MPCAEEEESELDLVNDYIVAGLRTADGLQLAALKPRYAKQLQDAASAFIASGAMTLREGRLAIVASQWLRSDYFIRELIL